MDEYNIMGGKLITAGVPLTSGTVGNAFARSVPDRDFRTDEPSPVAVSLPSEVSPTARPKFPLSSRRIGGHGVGDIDANVGSCSAVTSVVGGDVVGANGCGDPG